MSVPNETKIPRNFLKTDAISKHLYCTICQEVYHFPRRITCGHTYCNECINCWKKKNLTCPICRKAFTESTISKDLIAFNLINDLEVTCNNQGCVWKGILSELEQHLKYCSMDPETIQLVKKIKDDSEIEPTNLPLFKIDEEEKNYLNSNRILISKSKINLNNIKESANNFLNNKENKREKESISKPLVIKSNFATNNLNNIANKDKIEVTSNNNIQITNYLKIDSENSSKQQANAPRILFSNNIFIKNNNIGLSQVSGNSTYLIKGGNSKNIEKGLEALEHNGKNSKINEVNCKCPNCFKRLPKESNDNLRAKEIISASASQSLREDKLLQMAIMLSEQTYKEDESKRKIAIEEARILQENNLKNEKDKPARKKRSLPPSDSDSTYPKGKKIKKK